MEYWICDHYLSQRAINGEFKLVELGHAVLLL